MTTPAIQHHRWTRGQYESMVEAGVFGPEDRLELLDGYIVDVTPQSSRHASVVEAARETLRAAFGDGFRVRDQKPLALGERSEPEPDLAVVKGGVWDFFENHPTEACLVVDVASSSLASDRGLKMRLYARERIPEYWVIDLESRRIEVFRKPQSDGYCSRIVVGHGESVEPLSAPGRRISVSDVLP